MYARLPKKIPYLYVSLLTAMVAGRVAWGAVSIALYGMEGNAFTMQAFLAGAFLNAIPGIIIQIILIPMIMIALQRAGLLAGAESGRT